MDPTKNMTIGIIIQARMGSTRLPGKVLKPFYGEQTLIETLLSNLHKVDGAKIIVATSIDKSNDQLEDYLKTKGELVFRGSEYDVLTRFIQAAEQYNIDGIIRICSDNPFLDWHGVEELINQAKIEPVDYLGFRINNTPSIKTHFGFWGEFVTLDALKRVQASTPINSPAHEHVTIHVYSHPEEYTCSWIECPSFLQGRSDIRLTVDTQEDFNNAREIYSTLMEKNTDFTLKDVVKYLDENAKMKESMKEIIEKNQK